MPRNGGSIVDASARTILARNGITYPVDEVVVADDLLYVAHPVDIDAFWYVETWLLPAQSWAVNRLAMQPHHPDAALDWYIETDTIVRDGDAWRVTDGFLDVEVYDGRRYHVDDADELAGALAAGEITTAEAADALRALDRLCDELRDNGCSGFALLRKYAPALPAPRLVREPGGAFALANR